MAIWVYTPLLLASFVWFLLNFLLFLGWGPIEDVFLCIFQKLVYFSWMSMFCGFVAMNIVKLIFIFNLAVDFFNVDRFAK